MNIGDLLMTNHVVTPEQLAKTDLKRTISFGGLECYRKENYLYLFEPIKGTKNLRYYNTYFSKEGEQLKKGN